MCICTPEIKTPWCGKEGCERPNPEEVEGCPDKPMFKEDDGLECKFLKNLDKLQNMLGALVKKSDINFALACETNNQDKIPYDKWIVDRLDLIASLIGIYVEHELDRCGHEQHLEVMECGS